MINSNLKDKELQVLKEIARHRMITINEISKNTGLSWNTVKKYVNKFIDYKWVVLSDISKKTRENNEMGCDYYKLSENLKKAIENR